MNHRECPGGPSGGEREDRGSLAFGRSRDTTSLTDDEDADKSNYAKLHIVVV